MPIKIKNIGAIRKQRKRILIAMNKANLEIARVVKAKAIEDYKSKRKTDKMPSWIIDSFKYEITFGTGLIYKSIVFAGGSDAPYAKYVDQPRPYKGGKGKFPGYFFMRAGAIEGRKQAHIIIRRELMKSAGVAPTAILATRNID